MSHSFVSILTPADVERLEIRVADSSLDREFIVKIGDASVWISREHAEMLARDILDMIEQDGMEMPEVDWESVKNDMPDKFECNPDESAGLADEYIPDPRD